MLSEPLQKFPPQVKQVIIWLPGSARPGCPGHAGAAIGWSVETLMAKWAALLGVAACLATQAACQTVRAGWIGSGGDERQVAANKQLQHREAILAGHRAQLVSSVAFAAQQGEKAMSGAAATQPGSQGYSPAGQNVDA